LSNNGFKTRLGLKFSAVAGIALIIAFAVFLLLYEGVTWWVLYGPDSDSYWAKEGTIAIESFQEYVTENELTIDGVIRDVKWEKGYRTMYLYFSDSPNESIPEEDGGEPAQAGTPVQCADGVIFAYAYPSFSHYDSLGKLVSLSVATVCFFLILIPYVYRIIHRITHLSREMEILTGGDLSYRIDSPGEDELAELGRSIESMRISVLEQMARENEAILANSRLITSLSHDLRTPLTKLTGYLEIILLKKFKDASEEERYLNGAIEKAQQMKSLLDEMFRHFQIEPAPEAGSRAETVSGALLLSQLLSEMCFDLQAAGFDAELPVVDGEFNLTISVFNMRRVFDNLFSNIKKYADASKPVAVTVGRQASEIGITIQNSIGTGSCTDSRGIGLPTVKALIEQNGGRIDVTTSNMCFCARLFLPIVMPPKEAVNK
jgi:signal transduction histidine kinase